MSSITKFTGKAGNEPKLNKLRCNCGCMLFFMTSAGATCNGCKDVYQYTDVVEMFKPEEPTEPEVA